MISSNSVRRLGITVVMAVVALSVIAVAAATPDATWTALQPVPSPTEGMQTGVVGDKIIAAYGFSPSSGDTNLTRIYDIDHDTWSFGSPAPLPVRSEGTAVTHGGEFYAIGGRPVGLVGSNLERYTVATDTWVSLSPMTIPRAGLAAAVVGNSIYAIGGRSTNAPCSGGELADVERYDIATDMWMPVAPLPTAMSDLAAVEKGGKIYAFGGCAGSASFSDQVLVYDPSTDTWTNSTPMPRARAAFYQVGVKGDNIYVMGGMNPFLVTRPEVDVYDVAHDSWTTLAMPMLHPRGEMGVVSHGGRIYTVGGAHPALGTSADNNDVLKP